MHYVYRDRFNQHIVAQLVTPTPIEGVGDGLWDQRTGAGTTVEFEAILTTAIPDDPLATDLLDARTAVSTL